MGWLTAAFEFIAALLKVWLETVSRDNAGKEAGAAAARRSGAEAALERAKDAKSNKETIIDLSDADLLERLRRNRQRKREGTDAGRGE